MSGPSDPSPYAGMPPDLPGTAEAALRAISETIAEHPQSFRGCSVEFDSNGFGVRFAFAHYASLDARPSRHARQQ